MVLINIFPSFNKNILDYKKMIKRPANHIKETNSLAYVTKTWSEWAVNETKDDYGIDLDVIIFENNEITDINFPAQLKSTDNIKLKNEIISYSIDTEHLNYYFSHPIPFIFILYDNKSEEAYWIIIQDFVWDILNNNTPNWRNQKYNTLYLPIKNKIEDKDQVKRSIINTRKRIIQEKWYKLKIGEGLGLNETLEDIEKLEKFEEQTEIKTKEAKLILSNKFTYQGEVEKAIDKIMDIYKQDKKDLMHLKSIMMLTSHFNISIMDENLKLINLCMEGIKLAKELNNTIYESILILSKSKAIYYLLVQKVGSLLYSQKVSSLSEFGQIRQIFLGKQFEELTKEFNLLYEEIDHSLDNLIKNKEYYLLIYCLSELLDVSSMTIAEYKVYDNKNEVLKEEIISKTKLAEHLLKTSKVFKDKELELSIKSSVANLYYLTENSKAFDLMKEALKIANELNHKPEIDKLKLLLEQLKNNPSPYVIKDKHWQEKLTSKEFQELLKNSLQQQGIDLDSDDEITKAILLGLKDADPEKYYKHCKNLYIVYLSSSPLGQMIALPTLGLKMVYCPKKSNIFEGINLEFLFESFVEEYCTDCDKLDPRDPEWKCKVGWIEEMRLSEIIQKLLKRRSKKINNRG